MCIIVAKSAGVDIPSAEIFDNCLENNKDGIGFAYNKTGERPKIAKGFETVKVLEEMLKVHQITKEHNLVIHFRTATHGAKDQGNCHPFPLSQSFEDMRSLNCSCDCAVAHNGVFGSMPEHEQHSDTMKFIGGILASPEIINNLESPSIKELVKGYCGFSSKLAFLRPQGISLIGTFELEKGVSYSNKQFEKYTYYDYSRHKWNEWCEVHKKYDKCYKEHEKNGETWCYFHKKYDHCSWCNEHQVWDSCKYDKDIDVRLLDLRSSCEWCATKEGVSYNKEQDSYLCADCVLQLMSY